MNCIVLEVLIAVKGQLFNNSCVKIFVSSREMDQRVEKHSFVFNEG